MLIDWFTDHTLKTKLVQYIIPQKVFLISGIDYNFPITLMVRFSHVCCFGHEIDRSDMCYFLKEA